MKVGRKERSLQRSENKNDYNSLQNTFNVFPYEGIVHDVAVICFQNLLKFSDVIILIGTSEKNQDTDLLILKVKQTHNLMFYDF